MEINPHFRSALVCLAGLLAPSLGRAVPVLFSVHLDVPLAYGTFPDGATVGLAGTFNNWNSSGDALADTDGDGLWTLQRELSPGYCQWKFVIQRDDGSVVWESGIGNRNATIPSTPLDLPPAWWNRYAAPEPPLQPVQVLFRVDPGLWRQQGLFDPQTDQLRLQGEHTELGNWTQPGPELMAAGDGTWQTRVEFSALCDSPVAWKVVVVPGDGSPWTWEPGQDHLLEFGDDSNDQWPAPSGDGIADLELPVLMPGHEPGWTPAPLAWGADLSFTARLEHAGATWSRAGQPRELLDLFRSRGWSVLRLRLWHRSAEPWHGLDSTLALARRGQELGFRLLLDLHYSDSWTDPGQQNPPAAWQGLALPVLADSVRQWTAAVIQRFHTEGLDPEWLQLGNEIDGGLLWPLGDVRAANDTPAQWQNLATLLQAAGEGAWQDIPVMHRPKRVLHLANSGYTDGVMRFLGEMENRGVPFECTGLSYYPWWHGDLQALRSTLQQVGTLFGSEILVVETDYPWTLAWGDNENNFVGQEDQLLDGFPATPEGQRAYYESLAALLRDTPGAGVSALCAWEPAWIPATGFGSVQENLAFFDFTGEALTVLDVPMPATPVLHVEAGPPGHLRLVWSTDPDVERWRVEGSTGPNQPWQVVGETAEAEWPVVPAPGVRLYRVTAVDTTD